MKKSLLSLFFAIAMTCVAKADEVVVVFAGYNYEGDVTSKVEFSEGSSDTSINDKDFEVPGVCKFAFYKKVESTGFSYINPSGQTPHLQWAKQTLLNISPEKGVTITKITFACTTAGYTQKLEVDYPENFGECITEGTTPYWTGSATSDFGLTFTPKKSNPMRFSYMTIEYSEETSSIDNIAIDETTPAKYFNLQGIEVANPTKGKVYILRQGSESTKIIM